MLGIAGYGQSFTLQDAGQHGVGAPTNGSGKAGRWRRMEGQLAYYEVKIHNSYTSTSTHTHTHIHTHTHARTHARTHTRPRTHARTYTHTYTTIPTHTHARTHIHTHTHTHARTHAPVSYTHLTLPTRSLV